MIPMETSRCHHIILYEVDIASVKIWFNELTVGIVRNFQWCT